MGIVTLSDASGQYEAIMFQEGLNNIATCWRRARLLVTLQANVEGEDVRARIVDMPNRSIRPRASKRACASSCATRALASLASRLAGAGRAR
jgi:DNA polymerase-3 subunit alpha